jgi:ATP-dependent DNA helicase RecQ
MADQHEGLIKRGIKSYHFKGSYSSRQLDEAFRNLRYGKYKFAFVAPERLQNELFLEYLKNADISLIAIDEAHCISQWGFDFRPSYLNVRILRDLLPNIPVLALTASATPRVKADLAEALRIADAKVFEGSVRRNNLHLNIQFTPNKERQLLRLLKRLEGTGIIYAKTRRNCEQLAALLSTEGFTALHFHAGLDDKTKAINQKQWIDNKVRTMVATTAFGMGIDKSDCAWVIHWDVPDTLEGYYQEVGRGGRNGLIASAYLLYHQYDIARLRKSITDLPDPQKVESFYNWFCSHYQIGIGGGSGAKVYFSISELAKDAQLSVNTTLEYIRMLQNRGYWQFIESERSVPRLQVTSLPYQWNKLPKDEGEVLTAFYRIYPMSSDAPIRVDIERLASHFGLLPEQASKLLSSLHQKGVVSFEKEESKSAILFLVDRPPKKLVKLPPKFVDSWILSKKERSTFMIDFLASEECLFQQIEKYFGQEPQEKCGTCSRCTFDHYPDKDKIQSMRADGLQWDDIWFDLNCSPDEFRNT